MQLISKNCNEKLYLEEVHLQSFPLRTCSQKIKYELADRNSQ